MKEEDTQLLMQAVQAQAMKLSQLEQQLFIVSMLTEFILDHIIDAKDSSGTPLIPINLDDFEGFAKHREAEIHEQVKEFQKQQLAKSSGLNLNE